MPISFQCPHCQTVYDVADDLGGKFIMCRGCQKRGPVRAASGQGAAATASASAASPSRRKFLEIAGWSLASIGAIATGALLARKPWIRRRSRPEQRNPDDPRGPRGPRGPRPGEDAKEKKEAT